MDINKAFSFPFEDKDWIVKILIGGVLTLIPIVDFLVLGYLFKVLQKAAREGVHVFPAWEDWGNLFGQGFFIFLIGVIYFLIPGILLILGSVFLGGAFVAAVGHSFGAAPLAGVGMLLLVLGGLVGFIISLFVPMALAVYAANGEFMKAFDFSEIFSRIRANGGNYALAILVYIGVVIVLGILRRIPILGIIIGIFAGFYVGVAMSYLFGTVYRGSAAEADAPPVAHTM